MEPNKDHAEVGACFDLDVFTNTFDEEKILLVTMLAEEENLSYIPPRTPYNLLLLARFLRLYSDTSFSIVSVTSSIENPSGSVLAALRRARASSLSGSANNSLAGFFTVGLPHRRKPYSAGS